MAENSTDRNIERIGKLDTAALSDALDKLGIAGQCRGIKPRHHAFRLAGRAFTVRYAPVDAAEPGNVGDYIDDIGKDTVVVLDNGGRADATVWGDILTFVAHRNKAAGTVIDGACRDVHLCLELGYPVYSRSYSMRTGKDRVQVDAYNVPVTIGQARVRPGDLLRGDADGVVAIPREREDEVLSIAESIVEAEEQIRALVRDGHRLDEAREKLDYFALQSKEDE